MKFKTLLACLTLCSLVGCESLPFQTQSDPPVELLDDSAGAGTTISEPGLIPSASQRFKEVPLPMNLREDTERTFVYDSKNTQVARMVYYSKDSLRDLAQFYIRHTKDSGWKLASTTQVDESVTLLFNKPGRRLDVNVSRQGVGRSNKLVILYLPEEASP